MGQIFCENKCGSYAVDNRDTSAECKLCNEKFFRAAFLEAIPGITNRSKNQNNVKTSERSVLIEKTKASVVLVLCY